MIRRDKGGSLKFLTKAIDMNDVDKRSPEMRLPKPASTMPIPIEDLLRGANEVLLSHNNEIYRLRSTRNGKLILTK